MTPRERPITPCRTCRGLGALVKVPGRTKPQPAYWFRTGATTCDACDGTGEAEE